MAREYESMRDRENMTLYECQKGAPLGASLDEIDAILHAREQVQPGLLYLKDNWKPGVPPI